ncbi:MAG TPA: LPS export ABC transporter periplasmic protein LptC [Sideroxyarcus sp.]|nr:LPS export ABC transporter periplasmic protein LptC [Sideroxyarcus sp.]
MKHITHLLNKARAWLPLLPLLLLLMATHWLNQQVLPLPPVAAQQRHDVDYTIDNLSAVTLNAAGRPHQMLTAEKLWHYPDDDTTHLQSPRFSSLYADRPPTVTSSATGMLSSKGDEVFLYDDVHIRRHTLNGDEQRFVTNYLHLIPDNDWAETNRMVVMTDAHNTIRAVGMELDNKAHTVKLLSQVRSTHEPIE